MAHLVRPDLGINIIVTLQTRMGFPENLEVHPPQANLFELRLHMPTPTVVLPQRCCPGLAWEHPCIRIAVGKHLQPTLNPNRKPFSNRSPTNRIERLWRIDLTPIHPLADVGVPFLQPGPLQPEDLTRTHSSDNRQTTYPPPPKIQ